MTPPRTPPTLETRRLILSPLVTGDLEFVEAMFGDRDMLRVHPRAHPRVEALRWMDREWARYAEDGHGFWLARDRATSEPVGLVGLLMQSVATWAGARVPEIAFLLHRSWWSRGYATEAGLRVPSYAFETCGYPRVIALIRPTNDRAQAVARRLGMRPLARTTHAGQPHVVWGIDARSAAEQLATAAADAPPLSPTPPGAP